MYLTHTISVAACSMFANITKKSILVVILCYLALITNTNNMFDQYIVSTCALDLRLLT
jgi:hypothetical protein